MDTKIKVIIAEDDLNAQDIIGSFIEPLESFEIMGVADNGESLLDLVVNLNPHLVIVDINMPKLDGLKAISSCLKINPELKFIISTAYPTYAVDAFELNAVDYLVKPIKKERLYVALEKAKTLILNTPQRTKREILTVKMDRISYFVHFSSIVCIEKDSRKTIIHTQEQKYETIESLDSIMSRLNGEFFRSHRSFIVNVNYISHISIDGETYFAHFRTYPHYAHVSKLRVNELLDAISYTSLL